LFKRKNYKKMHFSSHTLPKQKMTTFCGLNEF
jgi:hypothetical protein